MVEVGDCAASGFLFAWIVGAQAVEFLKRLFWWVLIPRENLSP